ncbi:MAG TPA: serine/threonine-protein kinase, partial [Pirellulales bacterium]
SPGQLALQKGLLDAAQIDIIETLLRPTEVVPGYEILGVLGQGGMGVVYRARQLNLKRIVALKTVLVSQMGQRTALERFEQEAQALARLAHPHIVAVYDFGQHDGRLYYAMELVTGEDVHTLIRRKGALDERLAWGIVRQAAAGLAHAAEQGIVHRDIKPANLLLVEPPTGFPLPAGMPLVKIADFGLAQLAGATDERTRLTSVGDAIGSPNYMSPEQLLGDPVDTRTDIFSLGATAFHMLTGKPPLAGKALTQIVAARLSGQAESLRDLRPAAGQDSVELVAAMMAADPSQRFTDYRELTRRIDGLDLASPGSEATMAFTPPVSASTVTRTHLVTQTNTRRLQPSRFFRGNRLPAAIAGLAAILILAAFLWGGRTPAIRDLAPSGRIEELFNGQNINRWTPVSGSWSEAKNDEGAIVLQGRGVVRRSLAFQSQSGQPRPLEHYGLSLVIDPHQASAVEVQFDLAANNSDQTCLCLRIEPEACILALRSDTTGPPTKILARRPHTADTGELHAVEIERHSAGWWVLVDGQLLGTTPFVHAAPATEFRLLAAGGAAWFSDLSLEELLPTRR